MRSAIIFFLVLILSMPLAAQYAPQAGVAGSTAISYTSSQFVRWADRCTIQRGYLDIDSPAIGRVSYGDSTMALGITDHSIVSLGDSGIAVLQFPGYIYDGPGADFAVFENGFIDPANDSLAFLELAFVEVSSDGVNYVRFPAHSLTQTQAQIAGSGDYMYANLIEGLAGKYGAGFGTPFDLSDLPVTASLNKNAITHVRVVDVVGNITDHSSFDNSGHIINDPYPTNFPTGGFDLDAVGVINYLGNASVPGLAKVPVDIYPVPVRDNLHISCRNSQCGYHVQLTDIAGKVLADVTLSGNDAAINMEQYAQGIYLLVITDNQGMQWVEKITRY